MKRNIYAWHRRLAIIALIPVLMWTISGILHPIMSNFRPQMAKSFLKPEALPLPNIQVELDSALNLNRIRTIENFRIISFGGNSYYQVQTPEQFELLYLNTATGALLPNGDRLYATYLARTLSGRSTV